MFLFTCTILEGKNTIDEGAWLASIGYRVENIPVLTGKTNTAPLILRIRNTALGTKMNPAMHKRAARHNIPTAMWLRRRSISAMHRASASDPPLSTPHARSRGTAHRGRRRTLPCEKPIARQPRPRSSVKQLPVGSDGAHENRYRLAACSYRIAHSTLDPAAAGNAHAGHGDRRDAVR